MLSRKEGGLSKAFSRVKLKVDQNLGRAEVTRPLNDDSIEAERRIGNVQKAMERFAKAAKEYTEHCTKPPEELLVKSFQKNGEILGQRRDLGDIWLGAANAEKQLATERENLQSIIKSTIDDRCRHVEEQLANVRRMRKDLDNYILDMDAARRRYTQLMRQQGNNANLGGQSSYADGSWSSGSSPPPPDFSAEVASAWQKVECARDSLEAEMNEIIAHECEYSEVVLQFLEQQAAYHERSFRILKSVIPTLRERLDDSVHRPVFGIPLSDHLRLWHRRIALVIEYCCLHLLKFGKTEEGLFRVAAGASKIRRLKSKFNSGMLNSYQWPPVMPTVSDLSGSVAESGSMAMGQSSMMSSSPEFNLPSTDPNESGEIDVHALAGVLKQYLRELPDPLLTTALCEEWSQAASLPEEDRLVVIQALLSRLPPENYENLRYLVHFLSLLTQFADQNRMTPSNVGIVIGPSIMPSSARIAENAAAAAAMGANMQLTQPAVIVQTFIENVDLLFPGRTAFKPESHAYIYDNTKANSNNNSQKLRSSRDTLSPPPTSKGANFRRRSNGGSLDELDDEQSVPGGKVVEQQEDVDKKRWSGLPGSGAFLTNNNNQRQQSRQNNLNGRHLNNDNDKKKLAPPSQQPHGSPRVVRAILNTISHRHSRDLNETGSNVSSNISGFQRNFPISAETSTPTIVASRRTLLPSDMELTAASGSIHLNEQNNDDLETVGVLDTDSMKQKRGDKKDANLADAAFQRAIRAEVRRLKSKEMRNRFFNEQAPLSSSSNETTKYSAAIVPSETSTINASIAVPSIPRGVLIFPPVSTPSDESLESSLSKPQSPVSPSAAAAERYHRKVARDSYYNNYSNSKEPTTLSTTTYSVRLENDHRRCSLSGVGGDASYDYDSNKNNSNNNDHDCYNIEDADCKLVSYRQIVHRGEAVMRRVATIDRIESPEIPEHYGGDNQVVPGDPVVVHRPAIPPPPVPVTKVESSSNNHRATSAPQPTILPAYNTNGENHNNSKQIIQQSPQQPRHQRETPVGSAGPGPSLPRRRAPIAPPTVPPPPPPPTTPPAKLYPTYFQPQQLPPPLVPSPAQPLRSASTKTVVVSQTTPTSEYDPMAVPFRKGATYQESNIDDKNDSISDMVVTSL